MYFLTNHANGYIEEKNGNKYFNGGKKNDYGRDYIKFDSDNDLPLNKPLKFHVMIIFIRSVFEEGGKPFPQIFLDDASYEL